MKEYVTVLKSWANCQVGSSVKTRLPTTSHLAVASPSDKILMETWPSKPKYIPSGFNLSLTSRAHLLLMIKLYKLYSVVKSLSSAADYNRILSKFISCLFSSLIYFHQFQKVCLELLMSDSREKLHVFFDPCLTVGFSSELRGLRGLAHL